MNLKIAQVIGLNTDQKAAQVISSQREDTTFLAILDLVSDDAFTKGRQILSELEDFFFEFEGSVPEKLNATFKEAENKFSAGEDFSATGGPASGWSLGLAVIAGKVLYLIGKGEIQAYLKRSDKFSPLLSVGAPAELISGFVASGDRLMLVTTSLTSFLGEDLDKSLNLPIDTFEEELGGKIGVSESANQGLAALAIDISEENIDIAPLSKDLEQDTSRESITEFSEPNLISPKLKLDLLKGWLGRLPASFPKSGRGRLILAVVLILLIIGGVGYKYKLSRDAQKQAQFNQLLQEARTNFDAAKGLAGLNPIEAKNKLDLAKDKVNQALIFRPADNNAQDLKNQIEQELPNILQQSSVSNFPVFLDMDLVKKNFRADRMSLSGSKLLLLDPAVKTLVAVDLVKKSNQILAGSDQLGEAISASINGELAFIYSKDKGVLRADTTNQKITAVAKKSADFGKIQDIYGFAGNVYLLDNDKSQVWKYLPTEQGYSDARPYLTAATKVDFSNALRMQIESSVYVLKSGGEILRFTKGDKDNFGYSGLPSNVKDPKSFFVSSDTDNLYILDSGNSRLLILTKTGVYKGQITGNKFATATDLVVDEIGKKVYLLEGSKIYSVDLK